MEKGPNQMVPEVESLALVAYLKEKDAGYFGKVLELREAVEGWLSYIPQTFPHFTRHTVQHSEEIVSQLSKLLFAGDEAATPTVNLSATEAYILVAAAYLHDAGMVAADAEKARIIESAEWEAWTEGAGAKAWRDIAEFRAGHEPADAAVREFLADVQVRHVLAAFIRGRHHLRAANVISQHQASLGRFAYDDPSWHARSLMCASPTA